MRLRRSTSSGSGTVMWKGRMALWPSAAWGLCSPSRRNAAAAAVVASTSRRVSDGADIAFSFVARPRCISAGIGTQPYLGSEELQLVPARDEAALVDLNV